MGLRLHDPKELRVDDDGFLLEFEAWDEDVAAALAAREQIETLRPEQMDILHFLRDYYRKHRFFPIIRAVCRQTHQTKGCMTKEFADPVQAWKIAGLPNPGDEVIDFHSWNPLGY